MRLELGPNCKIIQLSSVMILMHSVCACVCVVCCGVFLVCFVFPLLKTGRFRADFFTLWWIFLLVKNLQQHVGYNDLQWICLLKALICIHFLQLSCCKLSMQDTIFDYIHLTGSLSKMIGYCASDSLFKVQLPACLLIKVQSPCSFII